MKTLTMHQNKKLVGRFLLEMPEEFVTVLPDAIGRTLNDYPGLSGSHSMAFDGESFE